MKILIIDGSDNRFQVEADTFELVGNSIRLFRDEQYEGDATARPAEDKLVAAYWGITGFEILDE